MIWLVPIDWYHMFRRVENPKQQIDTVIIYLAILFRGVEYHHKNDKDFLTIDSVYLWTTFTWRLTFRFTNRVSGRFLTCYRLHFFSCGDLKGLNLTRDLPDRIILLKQVHFSNTNILYYIIEIYYTIETAINRHYSNLINMTIIILVIIISSIIITITNTIIVTMYISSVCCTVHKYTPLHIICNIIYNTIVQLNTINPAKCVKTILLLTG